MINVPVVRPIRLGLKALLKVLGRPFTLLKPFVPQSLLGRSILIVLVPLLLLQIVAMYVLYDRHYLKLSDNLAENIIGDIETVIFMFERSVSPSQQDEVFAMARQTHRLITSFDFDTLPAQTPAHTGTATDRRLARFMDRLDRPFFIDSVSNKKEVLAYVGMPDQDGFLTFKIDKQRLFTSTISVFASWVFAASLLLIAVATLFLRNQVRPLRRLARAADRLGRGQQVALPIEGAVEVRQAASSFLDMQDRLNRYIRQRTGFLSGVSHDLRTPLTRMKLELALIKDKDLAANLNKDVADMERMIEGYLAFARGEGDEQVESIELERLIESVLTTTIKAQTTQSYTKALSPKERLSFIGAIEHGRLVSLRPNGLRRVLQNLFTNAFKYANGPFVKLIYHESHIELLVDDDGPGIPVNEYENVFQPFYRMESSRNSDTGGLGLGLPIVLDYVQKHGGAIDLSTSPLGGLRVHINLPV